MIVEFSVKNFRSIRDIETISFLATGLKSSEVNTQVDLNNISEENGVKLLKTVGIYGSNASGKSNIIKAFEFFLQAIKNEASSESNLKDLCDPFLYQENSNEIESFFQIVLIIKNKKYRYGFTVKKNNNINQLNNEKNSREIIISEWLFGVKDMKMTEYFKRDGKKLTKTKKETKSNIPPIQYDHTLFLTHAAAFDSDSIYAQIRKYIIGYTISNLRNSYDSFRWNSLQLIEQENRKSDLLNLLSSFNLNYNDIEIERDSNDFSILTHDKISFIKKFNLGNDIIKDIKLNLKENESDGTQKIFDIAGLLLRAFNTEYSAFIIIDEVDSNFHPSLLIKVINLFNSEINKSNAQLLFTSHDTNLMSPKIMRRDQFYFTEKKENLSTRLYSLSDLKGIRNDADFSKQYLAGYYGALPILDDFIIKTPDENERTLES